MSLSQRRRAVAGASVGTLVEGYDFAAYGTFAAIIAPVLFFPDDSSSLGNFVVSSATFGVAFVTRPIGSVVFGHLGDRIGRQRVLVWTLVLIGATTFAIGVLPTYASVGAWAPVLLVALRLLQGLSFGGEWGGATLIAVENAAGEEQRDRRGLFSGAVQSGLVCGSLLSTITYMVVVTQLPAEQLSAWGWRVPFLLGGVLSLVGVVIRLTVRETPDFTRLQERDQLVRRPVVTVLRHYPGRIALVALSYVGSGSIFYAVVIFGQMYGVSALGYAPGQMTGLLVLTLLVMAVTIPAFGLLADAVGHTRVILAGLAAMLVLIVPWFQLFATGNLWLAAAGFAMLALAISASYAPLGAFFAASFPAEVRYSGVSLGYQLGTVLGGALPPLLAVALLAGTGNVITVLVYLGLTVVVSVAATWALGRDRAGVAKREQIAEVIA